ncbi:MAG: micrococcal nuclease [Parcubacteria bacterium C7867-001]|nr:MAG: micrococcal nuclease [Parcubacteria bacterium C7867-001]
MSYRNLRKLLLALGFLVVFVYAAYTGADLPKNGQYVDRLSGKAVPIDPSVTFEYGKPIQIAYVVDGDTAQLINGEYVRYIGIDTPEEFDPRKPEQCYAKEAAAENRKLVQGQYVVIQKEITERDKYGRILGYLYLSDGTFVNKKLVEDGFAFAYPYKPDTAKADEFAAAEVAAKEAKHGLWSVCTTYRLSGGREQTNDLGR